MVVSEGQGDPLSSEHETSRLQILELPEGRELGYVRTCTYTLTLLTTWSLSQVIHIVQLTYMLLVVDHKHNFNYTVDTIIV